MKWHNLKITLVKSTIGCPERSAGAPSRRSAFRRLNQRRSFKTDNACIRGMIFKVKHLVKVEEVDA